MGSDNTKGCYDVINNALPMMLEACKAVLYSHTCICMYVCICVCVYAYIYIYIYIGM